MKLIIIALVVLIAWVICERWVVPRYKKQDPPERRGPMPGEQEAARQYSVFMDTSHARIKSNNRRRFLQELMDFCLDEGLDLKVFEDFEFDALGVRLHDKKTDRAIQARVEREKYESTPILCASRIKRAWEGAENEATD